MINKKITLKETLVSMDNLAFITGVEYGASS